VERPLTEALVRRHIQNHTGGWAAGMLDIAQDHLLCGLSEAGLFTTGLTFKGGTALRKCRSGSKGRFSTDLDFAAETEDLIYEIFTFFDDYECHGFRFQLNDANVVSGRADLFVYPPFMENSRAAVSPLRVASKVEISHRKPWVQLVSAQLLESPVHYALNHQRPTFPIVSIQEAVAEKLARYTREPLLRDLHDLWWYGGNCDLEESTIRSLWVKKVYMDHVLEQRWKQRTFDPTYVLSEELFKSLRPEEIGIIHDDSDVPAWDHDFRRRFRFLTNLSVEDLRWARCDPRDKYEFESLVNAI
jgi:hypothetical protein